MAPTRSTGLCIAVMFAALCWTFQANAAWKLTFEDNFDGTALDQTKWNPTGGVDNSYELESYSSANVEVSSGTLKLWVKKQTSGSKQYTSGKITTQNKFQQKYGRFECRMKIPQGKGMWPAFWMLQGNLWPPEIDIMENWGNSNNSGNREIASGVWCGGNADCTGSNAAKDDHRLTVSVDPTLDFHTYAMEWDASKMVFYFDSSVIGTSAVYASSYGGPMWIMLQVAICGAGWCTNPDAATVYPARLEADYVRVYTAASTPVVGSAATKVLQGKALGSVALYDMAGRCLGQSTATRAGSSLAGRASTVGLVLAVLLARENRARTTLVVQ